ncbi:MAG: prolipoprotein diacylglyceryl transferase family protein, partial [Alphaproteobacteria bacterium]
MIDFPNINPIAFTIPVAGGLPIRWYALAYIAGFLLGEKMMKHWVKTWPSKGMTVAHVDSLFGWVVLGGILGGRLGFVLFYNLPYYLQNPADILKTWEGGMSFHGGILGVTAAILLFCWRNNLHPADVG